MLGRFGTALALLTAFLLGTAGDAADGPKPLERIAFGSCAHQDKPQPIWSAITALKPELFLFIGDNIYADTEDMKKMADKYAKLAAVPGYQKLLKTCPVLATWDDHDYGANDAGTDYAMKKESQGLFLDFFGVAKDSPRRQREGVYHAEVYGPPGKRVQVILLDTRYFRSPLLKGPKKPANLGQYVANTDPTTTILGAAQWKWFEEQLRIPAEVRLVVTSIQLVAEDHGFEKWMNFPHERERFFQLLRDTKAGGVLLLSGDRHLAELSVMEGNVGYPIYDLTSSGLNQAFKAWRKQEVNRHRAATMNFGDNFGLVTIDWNRPDPVISLQIRDLEGDITIQQKLTVGLLQPVKKIKPAASGTLAAEALKHVGKEFTAEFQVRATGMSKTQGLVFLNSDTAFREPTNFTAVLDKKAVAALKAANIADPAAHFKGKTIRVTGTVSLFDNRPQIMVSDPKQIEVVEKK